MTATRRAALDALASPVRQELISQLGEGPATVRELATALGRSRQALHYHVALLERAGLVAGRGWRGTGPARERVYAVARSRITFAASRDTADRAGARRALSAMLRLTAREVDRALAAPDLRLRGAAREIAALRGKARLSSPELGELHRLFGRIEALLRRAKQGKGRRFYAVTLVLVPAGTARQGETPS
jgi:DNA-binding transcriptional ArsR family regulator